MSDEERSNKPRLQVIALTPGERMLQTKIEKLERELARLGSELGVDGLPDSPKTLREAIDKMNTKAQETLGEILHTKTAVDDHFAAHVRSLAQQMETSEKTVKEKVAHDASKAVWEAQAETHRRNAQLLMIVTAVLFAALLAGVIYLGVPRFDAIVLSAPADATALSISARYLALTVLAAAVAIIPVWVIRIVLRLFLTERQLAERAEERAAMTATLVGLSTDTKLEAKHKAIILQALYGDRAVARIEDGSPLELVLRSAEAIGGKAGPVKG